MSSNIQTSSECQKLKIKFWWLTSCGSDTVIQVSLQQNETNQRRTERKCSKLSFSCSFEREKLKVVKADTEDQKNPNRHSKHHWTESNPRALA